jgi:hypothetical protein
MSGRTRPDGRKCVLARAALATLKDQELRERETAAAAPTQAFAPVLRGMAGRGIRLIDLERRARFACFAFDVK